MKTLSMSKRGWVAALGGVLLAASVTVAAGATSAAAVNVPLGNALVNRVAGSTTNVTLVNAGVAGNAFPAAPGATIDILFSSVTKADGSAVSSATGVLATWCGNVTATGPTAAGAALLGADVGGLDGIAAHCTPIPTGGLTATTTGSDVEVTGDLTGLPTGTECRSSAANQALGGGPTVIPCLLIVANLAQEVALALPLSNITTAQVAGPLDIATSFASVIADCTSSAPAASRSCPSTRPTTSATPGAGLHPVAFGGVGFFPAANNNLNPANPTTWVSGNQLGVVKAGDVSICTDAAGTSCVTTGLSPLAAAYAQAVAASPVGQVAGALTISAAPGNYFLKVKYSHYALTADSPAFHTPIAATGNAVSLLEQTQMAPVTVLAAPSCTAAVPASGGVGATTSISCSGLEPYQAGTVDVLDANGFAVGVSTAVTSSGTGAASATGLAAQYPAASVKVTFTHGAENGAAFSTTKAFDSTQVNSCADAASCAAALITTVTVLPGNIALFTDDPSFALNDVDLSTIDLSDNGTWYPLGDPATSPIVLIGDFTGSNAGFAITGAATAMQGAAVKANTIPAYDIWYGNINCAVEGDISGNASVAGNEPFGAITAGADSAPDMDSDGAPSPLADGSADICSVAADANGREGGVFELQLDVQAAGRVNTAADDYSGLIILTVTSAP